MTFEEFKATRKSVTDLRAATGMDGFVYEHGHGFIYSGGCYIESVEPLSETKTLLVVWHDSWLDTLEANERRLYDWCVEEGLFE